MKRLKMKVGAMIHKKRYFLMFSVVCLTLISVAMPSQGYSQQTERIPITLEAYQDLTLTKQIGQGQIYDVAIHPDGDIVAIASATGTWVYHYPDFTLVREQPLEDRIAVVSRVEFSADGSQLFTVGGCAVIQDQNVCGNGRIHIWDVDTWTKIRSLENPQISGRLELSADNTLITGSDGDLNLLLIDVQYGTVQATLPKTEYGGIYSASFSPDGERLITGGVDHHARVWDIATQTELANYDATIPLQISSITDTDYANNGRWMAFSTQSGQVYLWDAQTLDEPILLD